MNSSRLLPLALLWIAHSVAAQIDVPPTAEGPPARGRPLQGACGRAAENRAWPLHRGTGGHRGDDRVGDGHSGALEGDPRGRRTAARDRKQSPWTGSVRHGPLSAPQRAQAGHELSGARGVDRGGQDAGLLAGEGHVRSERAARIQDLGPQPAERDVCIRFGHTRGSRADRGSDEAGRLARHRFPRADRRCVQRRATREYRREVAEAALWRHDATTSADLCPRQP